jgi:hypothetical protein
MSTVTPITGKGGCGRIVRFVPVADIASLFDHLVGAGKVDSVATGGRLERGRSLSVVALELFRWSFRVRFSSILRFSTALV